MERRQRKRLMDHREAPLLEALRRHVEGRALPFHVPGHRMGRYLNEVCQSGQSLKPLLAYDLTELDGLDNLHYPDPGGPIGMAQQLAADAYGVQETLFLVNGSTVGNLAMILSLCRPGDTVLMQRNVHQSLIHAAIMGNLRVEWIFPTWNGDWQVPGPVTVDAVKAAIERVPDAKAVVLTHPSYYGQAHPIGRCVNLAHQYDIPVLVDEAHGAHFAFSDLCPLSAVEAGADMVVQSAHKTLPALTMGAWLHLQGGRVNSEDVRSWLRMLQTSSPSYLVMASLDFARREMALHGAGKIRQTAEQVSLLARQLEAYGFIYTVGGPGEWDPLRIMIGWPGLDGEALKHELQSEGVFVELSHNRGVLFMFGAGWREDERSALERRLGKLVERLRNRQETNRLNENKSIYQLCDIYSKACVPACLMAEAARLPKQKLPLHLAGGRIAAALLVPYPPGVPLVMPGEVIDQGLIELMREQLTAGADIHGVDKRGCIEVLTE
jgi:arginine/lysine/ornithine decarboxylase